MWQDQQYTGCIARSTCVIICADSLWKTTNTGGSLATSPADDTDASGPKLCVIVIVEQTTRNNHVRSDRSPTTDHRHTIEYNHRINTSTAAAVLRLSLTRPRPLRRRRCCTPAQKVPSSSFQRIDATWSDRHMDMCTVHDVNDSTMDAHLLISASHLIHATNSTAALNGIVRRHRHRQRHRQRHPPPHPTRSKNTARALS